MYDTIRPICLKNGVIMSIIDLTEKVKARAKTRTRQERKKLLVDAHILTEDGKFNSRFFSETTIEQDKRRSTRA
jgi:hypothetical protein